MKLKISEHEKMGRFIRRAYEELENISIFLVNRFGRKNKIVRKSIRTLNAFSGFRFELSKLKDKEYPQYRKNDPYYFRKTQEYEEKMLKKMRRKMLAENRIKKMRQP